MTSDQLCINTIRALAIDAVEKAQSGHPGLPLGAAPMAYTLWHRTLNIDPSDPGWADRDRFVLSAGHGSMLLYALLHLSGYELSLDDIQRFRQWGSPAAGHPERFACPGVEATTGPLGQGTANSVGMAIAERMLATQYNRDGHTIVDHFTYALVSDGDLMEGIAYEAASLAGHLRLGKLIWLYDSNDVSLDGPLNLAFTDDVAARHRACGWHVQTVEDGNTDLEAIDNAVSAARADASRPSLIIVRTTLGYGSPNKAGTPAAHGAPLGTDEAAATKKALGWDHPEAFFIPEEARQHFARIAERGAAARRAWSERFDAWAAAHPDLAATWKGGSTHALPANWDAQLPSWAAGDAIATRNAGGEVLNAIAARVPWLVGGDADISSSTKTHIEESGPFPEGKNLHFGVREHAMAAIANGIAYHGGLHPFVSTFFQFVDYMRPSVRLAAMNRLPVTFVFTHDSVAVGEDGPTHQPVEQLASLRIIPNLTVLRPADANETARAWRFAMNASDGPVALVLSRQKLTTVTNADAPVERGAYILADADDPQALLIATGSEVGLAVAARDLLAGEGVRVRVVSMPSMELFAAQDGAWRDAVLPPAVTARVAVEAGVRFGWERWVGDRGDVVSIDRFGASAPGDEVLERLGMTAEKVAAAVRSTLAR